jgi:hypothetical protein
LDATISRLEASLGDDLWLDDIQLDPRRGHQLFDADKFAVSRLADLTALPEGFAEGLVARIIGLDRVLVEMALADAIALDGDARKIDKALRDLARGDLELAAGRFGDAIEHYKNAWKKAQEAVKKLY